MGRLCLGSIDFEKIRRRLSPGAGIEKDGCFNYTTFHEKVLCLIRSVSKRHRLGDWNCGR